MTRKTLLFLTAALLFVCSSGQALENRLANHPSPYLAMHGEDPVHWQSWGSGVLDLASQQGKLIFVSSGYFACHWCHVMHRESFQNPEVAALLNKYFIPVKVDRELEPALDAHLIDFVQRTQGRAGWPLNVFLTPEGYPLVGATYLPQENFQQLLERLQRIWEQDADKTRNMARRGLLALINERDATSSSPAVSATKLRTTLISSALQYGDEMLGGFGQQNRFPMAPQLTVLLKLQASYPQQQLADFLTLTLDQMARQGLRDHLAGGFYRYTVDPDWQVPHYEKMLYTQAQLALLYLEAADVLKRPDYLGVVANTLEFVMQYMAGRQGGYIASFSAVDDQDREGGYYLWTQDELETVLKGAWLEPARRYWRLTSTPGDTAGVLPRRGESVEQIATALDKPLAEVGQLLDQAREKLLAVRSQRVLPPDYKELAGWNGLMLAAFSRAAVKLQRDDFRQAAQKLAGFLRSSLWDGEKLARARDGERAVGASSLEDYAYVAFGFAELAKLTGDKTDRALSEQLLHNAWERFYAAPGWLQADQALLPGMPKDPAQDDGALPSPAAMVISLSVRVADSGLAGKVGSANREALPVVQEQPFWYASHGLILIEHAVNSTPDEVAETQR